MEATCWPPARPKNSINAVVAEVPKAEYRPLARAIMLQRDRKRYGKGVIAVVSAGTSDIPVAEEAVVTAELMGNRVQHLYDVGVAGIHRLLAHRSVLAKARVIIVCAGMEGALPSVVGGLVGVPVIAVPTSIGYGAAFEGLAALLGMMNSCARNVSVVNIDNGFGAGVCGVADQPQIRTCSADTPVREKPALSPLLSSRECVTL